MRSHLISWMITLPFLGALFQAILPPGQRGHLISRGFALFSTLLASIFALFLVFSMKQGESVLQFSEKFSWISSYVISYEVGVDGLSALMVLLVAFVFPILILFEWHREQGSRGVYGLFLLLQSSLFGLVCSQDLFLIFFFWALSTLPFYFLITMWGDDDRENAAFRYLMTACTGNALFFLALILVYYAVEPHSFSIADLIGGKVESAVIQIGQKTFRVSILAFLLMALGFAFRIPVFPFHGWFTSVICQAPASVCVALGGVFVPVAFYVFTRLAFSLFPDELFRFSDVILIFGGVNVVFGALSSLAQRELRMFFSFVCVVQLGLVLMGLGSLDSAGVMGAVYQQLVLGLGLTGFGLFSGFIRERVGHSRFIVEGKAEMGGLVSSAPVLAVLTGIIAVSLLGFPGSGGFIGQSLIMMGGYAVRPWSLAVIAFGMVMLAYGIFSVYRKVFLGKAGQETTESVGDLAFGERMSLTAIVGVLLYLGLYPRPFLELVKPSVLTLLSMVR